MPVKIDIPYKKTFTVNRSLAEAFSYIKNVKTSIPECFPGVESFLEVSSNVYLWEFEKVGYSGYEIQIKLKTQIDAISSHQIKVSPIAAAGTSLFKGGWTLSQSGEKTEILFEALLEVELPIPFFLKSMATPLAQKELTKLFDRYVTRAEKNLS
jgi:carbon monoxide dehydrogenase subunit G